MPFFTHVGLYNPIKWIICNDLNSSFYSAVDALSFGILHEKNAATC